jgi:acetyl esterase/lipase
MLDDSTRFAAKAKSAGVDVTLTVGEKMIHCYPLLAPMFPEATQAMDEICDFIKKISVNKFRILFMGLQGFYDLGDLCN